MAKYNPSSQVTESSLLAQLGHGLAQRRIRAGFTQMTLAQQAGVGKRTIERLEAGHSIQLAGLIRILRTLGRLDDLAALMPSSAPAPMDLLKAKSGERRRASTRRRAARSVQEKWTWGETA